MTVLEYGRVFFEPMLTVLGGTGQVTDRRKHMKRGLSRSSQMAFVYLRFTFVEKGAPGYLEIHGSLTKSDGEPRENCQLVPTNLRYCHKADLLGHWSSFLSN